MQGQAESKVRMPITVVSCWWPLRAEDTSLQGLSTFSDLVMGNQNQKCRSAWIRPHGKLVTQQDLNLGLTSQPRHHST